MLHISQWTEVLLKHPVEFFCCFLSVGAGVRFRGFSQDTGGKLRLLAQIRDNAEVS